MPAMKVWPFIDMTLLPNPVSTSRTQSVRTCGLSPSQIRQRNPNGSDSLPWAQPLTFLLLMPWLWPATVSCFSAVEKIRESACVPVPFAKPRGTHCRGEALP